MQLFIYPTFPYPPTVCGIVSSFRLIHFRYFIISALDAPFALSLVCFYRSFIINLPAAHNPPARHVIRLFVNSLPFHSSLSPFPVCLAPLITPYAFAPPSSACPDANLHVILRFPARKFTKKMMTMTMTTMTMETTTTVGYLATDAHAGPRGSHRATYRTDLIISPSSGPCPWPQHRLSRLSRERKIQTGAMHGPVPHARSLRKAMLLRRGRGTRAPASGTTQTGKCLAARAQGA